MSTHQILVLWVLVLIAPHVSKQTALSLAGGLLIAAVMDAAGVFA